MFVTKKSISRRTVLRGVGAAVALPLLDAMVPAFATAATTPAPVRRFGVVYHPNGVIYDKWLPTGAGTDFELSPTLAGLKPFRDKLIVVTGSVQRSGGGARRRRRRPFARLRHLSDGRAREEVGQQSWRMAISMDQIAAKAFERETQLSSLQMTADENSLRGILRSGL